MRGRRDAAVARIAEGQRGVVSRPQLVSAGLSAAAIKHRLKVGQLHVLYPGVYLFGRPRLEALAAETAAVMYLEGRGVLSHGSAANLWGLCDAGALPDAGGLPVHVTAVGCDVRSRGALIVHHAVRLEPRDVGAAQGLPATSPARTIVDLAAALTLDELEAVLALALRRRLVTIAQVTEALARTHRPKGAAQLRKLLEQGMVPTLTRSKYERKLVALLRRAELPTPLVNCSAMGHEVDLLWPEHKLVVEFDGFGYHSDRRSFEEDRLRDQHLVAAGYRVIRVTARQLDRTPEAVVARIAAALAH